MQIEKISDVWITEKTLSKHFKNAIVYSDESELTIEENKIYLKFINGIHYEVYGTNKSAYYKLMNSIKFVDHYFTE